MIFLLTYHTTNETVNCCDKGITVLVCLVNSFEQGEEDETSYYILVVAFMHVYRVREGE